MKTLGERMFEIVQGLPSDMPQRQDALNDQLKDLRVIAQKLRMYDAADYLGSIVGEEILLAKFDQAQEDTYIIYAKGPEDDSFAPLDTKEGRRVISPMFATKYNKRDAERTRKLLDNLNKDYEFDVVEYKPK